MAIKPGKPIVINYAAINERWALLSIEKELKRAGLSMTAREFLTKFDADWKQSNG